MNSTTDKRTSTSVIVGQLWTPQGVRLVLQLSKFLSLSPEETRAALISGIKTLDKAGQLSSTKDAPRNCTRGV
jgi:hypothetical protein